MVGYLTGKMTGSMTDKMNGDMTGNMAGNMTGYKNSVVLINCYKYLKKSKLFIYIFP